MVKSKEGCKNNNLIYDRKKTHEEKITYGEGFGVMRRFIEKTFFHKKHQRRLYIEAQRRKPVYIRQLEKSTRRAFLKPSIVQIYKSSPLTEFLTAGDQKGKI